MKNRALLRYSVAILLGLPSFGQVFGSLTGSIQDPSGAAVPGAEIQLFLAGGVSPVITGKTNTEGLFRITAIRPETYKLRIEATGFNEFVQPGLVIAPARETSLPPLKLELGAVAQRVDVTTVIESVQTSNVEVANTVTMTQVAKLPVINRSPLSLIGTQAGVLTSGSDSTTINGQRTTFSNVTLNGVNIQDNFIRTGSLDFLPNLLLMGQVAEVTVSSSNMDASQSAASAVTFLTPSGGNTYHGEVYWSNRNNVVAANTWFNNQSGVKLPFLNQNQLGGSVNGAIIKDKWFFFVNYEAFRLRQTSSVTTTIPTADARNGIYTYRDLTGAVQKVNLLTAAGASINPTVAPILAKVPTPDKINTYNVGDSSAALARNTGGYMFLTRYNRTRDNVTGTTDYVLSMKHNFNATFSWNRDILDRVDSSIFNDYSLVPKVSNDDTAKLFTMAWRWAPTPTLTNELRGGLNFAPAVFATSEQFPSSIIDGFVWNNPLNTFRAQGRNTRTYNLNDNASWVKGKHFVKFGFSFQDIRTAPYNDAGITPTYTIGMGAGHQGLVSSQFPGGISSTDLTGANNLLASLTGALTSSSQTFNITSTNSGYVNGATNLRNFIYDNYAFYIQDNWRLRRNFTLEAGLRYEYFTPLRERDNLEIFPNVVNNDPVATMLNPNATFNFVNGGMYKADKKDFGPRIGFAWDLKGDGKTAIRGGYGIYFVNDSVITTVRNNVETNAGIQATATASGLKSFADSPTPVVTPTYKMPRSLYDNYLISTSNAFGLVNPNLKTPYVGQYSLSVQHDFKGNVLSVAYVGNHGTKLLRGIDYNQVTIKQNGFLADFLRAQNNGWLAMGATGKFNPAFNSSIAGSQPLTIFPTMPSGGYLTNSSVLTYLQQSQVGQLAYFYQVNAVNGNMNFFTNPYTLGANYINNGSDSSYNSLQVDVRRRTAAGLTLQGNYTWSKVLSNSTGDTQFNFEPLLDNDNPGAERAPAPFDLRHVFKANAVWDIPVGPGHRFNPHRLGRVVGGWSLGSVMTWQSGTPFTITTGARGTLNRGGRSTYNTATALVSGSALADIVSYRMTGNGPYMVASSAIGSDGRGTAADGSRMFTGQAFANPGAGSIGALQRRMFYGPNAFGQDLSISKEVKLFERHTLLFRADAQNVWNHPTFYMYDSASGLSITNINSTTFGKLTSSLFGRRLVQFSLYYKF
ncbi:MAG: TonB-dependent receptor [Acidobacteria bacterium]|nr:TonB-dependent receptor [Acidobacteriota bacterium]